MSHYGGSNAWQNPKNAASSQQQQQQQQQSAQSQQSAASSLYSNPANLLAQFAATANLNSQLNSLAANLPAVLISAQSAAGYQWHSQNKLVTATKTPTPANNNQVSQGYGNSGVGNKPTSGYANNNNHHHNTPKSLMDLDVNKARNNGNGGGHMNQQQRYNDNNKHNINRGGDQRPGQNASSGANSALGATSNSSAVLTQSLLNQIALTNQLAAAQTLGRLQTNLADINRNKPNNKIDDGRSHSQRRSRSRSNSRANSVHNNNNHQKYRQGPNNHRNDSVNNKSSGAGGRAHSKSRSPRRQQQSASVTKKPITSSSSSSSTKYTIKLPRDSFDLTVDNVSGIKAAHSNLYVPSDFSNAKYGWVNSLPINRPLKFTSRCSFHIMSKDAHPLTKNTAVLEPSDLDYRWNAKVMLLAMPSINDLFKRSCAFADDVPVSTGVKDNRHDHPSKVIQFLVGNKGKHELMALGGPWSPSLDGPNPALNTQTLINCAIRNVKALTGIDLNPCTQWFRFIDIQYNRSEGYRYVKRAGTETANGDAFQELKDSLLADPESKIQLSDEELQANEDADVENTVIFLPNVWSLMPDSDEYQRIVEAYKNFVDNPPDEITPTTTTTSDESTEKKNETVGQVTAGVDESVKPESSDNNQTQQKSETQSPSKPNPAASESNTSIQMSESGAEDAGADTDAHVNAEPTHHSKLDLKKMRVDELRMELAARKLDTTGLKAQLLNRLKAVIEAEKEKEESEQAEATEATGGDESGEDEMQIDTGAGDPKVTESVEHVDNQTSNDDTKEEVKTVKSENEQLKETNSASAASSTAPKLTKADRERIYKLPNNPHIVIHSSKTYKGGKFDCQLVSLSHLLDYRKDDNKECSFEVFLFAECFNSMLMRDHAFHIYKHLLSLNEEAASNKRKLASSEESGESGEAKKLKTDEASNSSPVESGEPASKDTDKQITPAKPAKARTLHPELLLAFTYFDTHRSGQLYERDLEDLFFLIGLNLTRSKIKALFKKITSTRDGLVNYRQLTDLLPNSVNSLANAVHYRLPDDEEFVNNLVSFEAYMRRLNSGSNTLFQSDVSNGTSSASNNQESLIVEINGRAIDILNTVKKLEDCELNLLKLETKCKESLEEIDRLKVVNRSGERAKQRINDELDECKKKMREQQRSNKELDDKYVRAKDSLYKTKSYLNRALDEVNDFLKRGQPKSTPTSKSTTDSASNSMLAKSSDLPEDSNVDENSKQNADNESQPTQQTKQEQADVFDDASNKNNDDDFTSDNYANGNFEENSNNAVA